jgi:hypothetical protein
VFAFNCLSAAAKYLNKWIKLLLLFNIVVVVEVDFKTFFVQINYEFLHHLPVEEPLYGWCC